MKTRISIITSLAVALLVPIGIVHASDSAAPPADAKAVNKDAVKKEEPVCNTAPGSRIRASKPEECRKLAKQPYRSYSKEELDSTGEPNLAEALRKLDPSIR